MYNRLTELINEGINNIESFSEKIAIVYSDGHESITFRSFEDRILGFVHKFHESGIKSGDIVAISIDRGPDAISAFMASLIIGSPFVYINPNYSEKRKERILKNCSPKLTVDINFVKNIDSNADCDKFVPVSVPDDAPAIIYYTSGSTGEPKGVVCNREFFVRAFEACNGFGCYGNDVSSMSVTDFMFVASVFDWLPVLTSGTELHILSDDTREDISLLREYIATNSIDVCLMNPNLLRLMGADTGLHTAIVVGEKPGIFKDFDDTEIINLYGSTEILPISYHKVVNHGIEPTIGNPLKGERLLLLDEKGSITDKGEVCIRCSHPVSRYMDSTLSCGFVEDDGSFVYHSGDLGMMTADGIVINSGTPSRIVQHLKSKISFDERKYSYDAGCPLFGSSLSMFNFTLHTDMNVTIPEVITDDGWTSAEKVRDSIFELIRIHPIPGSRVVRHSDGTPWLAFGNEMEIPIVDSDPKSFSSKFYRRFDLENDLLTRFAIVCWNG